MLPRAEDERPAKDFLRWHQEHIYLGQARCFAAPTRYRDKGRSVARQSAFPQEAERDADRDVGTVMPDARERPAPEFLRWHNE